MAMAISWKWLIQILAAALSPIVGTLTPVISQALNAFLTDLYRKALVTENPWDDYVVGMLLDILAIPRPPP